jgi:hypothetical protein
MGSAQVISLSEVRASRQWQGLRDHLHARFDQWLDRLQPFPLSLQAQCSRGQLHWPFVNLDAKIPPDVNVLIFS